MQQHQIKPEILVEQNVACYNNRDLNGFMELFSEDIELYTFPEHATTIAGIDKLREMYKSLFESSPHLHATVLNRIVFNNKVIDHERIEGRMGSKAFIEFVVIYEVSAGKIRRLTVMRQ
ncbi:nuclear transport factor 2 family protein [Chryseolinea sp. H1M3-3]|uniref:nuclear transport factor 2 family protein n=1 Tax=Chryseolinea sp. H1M3-3 TaxID=3034144 RepID=UPI0023EAF368|nr:nuclear transport factor 2 family protein [Chryseolinea sp. H1M3-3]